MEEVERDRNIIKGHRVSNIDNTLPLYQPITLFVKFSRVIEKLKGKFGVILQRFNTVTINQIKINFGSYHITLIRNFMNWAKIKSNAQKEGA